MTILFAIGIGFYGAGSSFETSRYDSLAACERDRTRVEANMLAHGYERVRTACNEAKERGS